MTYGCKIMVSLTLCGFFWTTLYNSRIQSFWCQVWLPENKICFVIKQHSVGFSLTFPSAEYLIPPKHLLKILWKFEHFPQRYKRKRG